MIETKAQYNSNTSNESNSFVKFFKRKREEVFADLLIGTLVTVALFVIFFSII